MTDDIRSLGAARQDGKLFCLTEIFRPAGPYNSLRAVLFSAGVIYTKDAKGQPHTSIHLLQQDYITVCADDGSDDVQRYLDRVNERINSREFNFAALYPYRRQLQIIQEAIQSVAGGLETLEAVNVRLKKETANFLTAIEAQNPSFVGVTRESMIDMLTNPIMP